MDIICNPKEFLLKYQTSSFRIKEVRSNEVTSVEQWLEITSPDSPDIHTKSYLTQIQYHINGTRGHYLQVTDSGEVKANSQKVNPRTFFTVVHDFLSTEHYYQFFCYSQKYVKLVLFMDGNMLRTRVHNENIDQNDESTKFILKTKGNCGIQPFEIISKKTNKPLRFDIRGNFVPNDTVTNSVEPPYHFKISLVDQMKITAV